MTDWSDFVPRLLPRKTPGPGEFNWGRGVGPGVKAKPGELLALGTNHYLTRAGFPSPNLAQSVVLLSHPLCQTNSRGHIRRHGIPSYRKGHPILRYRGTTGRGRGRNETTRVRHKAGLKWATSSASAERSQG